MEIKKRAPGESPPQTQFFVASLQGCQPCGIMQLSCGRPDDTQQFWRLVKCSIQDLTYLHSFRSTLHPAQSSSNTLSINYTKLSAPSLLLLSRVASPTVLCGSVVAVLMKAKSSDDSTSKAYRISPTSTISRIQVNSSPCS